ncbi:DUF423 domain-containing protein [Granulosicoccus sp. 3-233]|uniref:DUF423 domain-containing protein n=1 Tax=Granulosicoccus sp. 3-233 TaxID=3417969 RepID=UPI003D34E579
MRQLTDSRWMLILASLLGAIAVMSGAFGAHALQGVLDERATGWYDTAVTYHARHALALLACGVMSLVIGKAPGSRFIRFAAIGFTLGTLVFSGSLYMMAFTGITKLGMVTPVGGLLLIIAWLCLAMAAFRLSSEKA